MRTHCFFRHSKNKISKVIQKHENNFKKWRSISVRISQPQIAFNEISVGSTTVSSRVKYSSSSNQSYSRLVSDNYVGGGG